MKQIDEIREHLLQDGDITSLQAFGYYGCTRLAAVIYKLKQRGMHIKTIMETGKNRWGRPVTYARYVLIQEDENAEN